MRPFLTRNHTAPSCASQLSQGSGDYDPYSGNRSHDPFCTERTGPRRKILLRRDPDPVALGRPVCRRVDYRLRLLLSVLSRKRSAS